MDHRRQHTGHRSPGLWYMTEPSYWLVLSLLPMALFGTAAVPGNSEGSLEDPPMSGSGAYSLVLTAYRILCVTDAKPTGDLPDV